MDMRLGPHLKVDPHGNPQHNQPILRLAALLSSKFRATEPIWREIFGQGVSIALRMAWLVQDHVLDRVDQDLRISWKQRSPVILSRLAGTTTLVVGIRTGWPVPTACHRSISTSDHQMRIQRCSSESGSSVSGSEGYFQSLIVFASATARARREGSEGEQRQSASMMRSSNVCTWTILIVCVRSSSLVSHSCMRALASFTLPDDDWATANRALMNALLTLLGQEESKDSNRALLLGKMG
jgi:hypothetical protein